MASSISAHVDSDDEEVFWGPVTLKEIKASLKVAEKLNAAPESDKPKDQSVESGSKTSFANGDLKENEIYSEEIRNGTIVASPTTNRTPVKSPSKLETSHIASTPRKLMDISSENSSESRQESMTDSPNRTPQTTPVKETSTYTTPSLLSPSQNDCDSSFASVTSSFVDESESPALEVASESFEKVDPKRYNARNINHLNISNSITDSHPDSDILGSSDVDSNLNPVMPITNYSFTQSNMSGTESKTSREVDESLVPDLMKFTPKSNTFFTSVLSQNTGAMDEKSGTVNFSPFHCVTSGSHLTNNLHVVGNNDLNKLNGNYVSPEIKFQSFQRDLENKSLEKNLPPDLQNNLCLNKKHTADGANLPVFRESKIIMEYEKMLDNFTSKLSKESEKLIDDFKAEIMLHSFDMSEENFSDTSIHDEETTAGPVTVDYENPCGSITSPGAKLNSPTFDNSRLSLKPLNFSQLTEANISLESPPNITLLDDTLTSVNQSRLSIPMNISSSKTGKKFNKAPSNLTSISEKLNPKKKFFSNLAAPKVQCAKQPRSNTTPTSMKEYNFKTPASKEPKKSETEAPAKSLTKSKLLPSFSQSATGKFTPCVQKTPTKNQALTAERKKKFFSTPQSVKSLKDSTPKQRTPGVSTGNSKFDRLSPSSIALTSLPNPASTSKKNVDSCGKVSSEPKKKFFSSSQFSKIPSGPAKLEVPKKNLNSNLLKSPKQNCNSNPPKVFSKNNTGSSAGKNVVSSLKIPSTSIPKFFPRNVKNIVQNQENVSNSAPKSECLESPASKYNSDTSLPLSDASFNSSINSNKSLTSRIPKQNTVEDGSKNLVKSRLPRFNDASKIPKVNFIPIRKTEKQ